MGKSKVIKDQQHFFNQNAYKDKIIDIHPVFYEYADKEQISGLKWVSDCEEILDFGCGTGTSINKLLKVSKNKKLTVTGVDIAERAIYAARENFPDFKFFVISNNEISQVEDDYFDGAYMLHVLHHTTNHEDIFKEINAKLKSGGKFLINDLTSQNPIISLGRFLFSHLSGLIGKKFEEDLVVDGDIPHKYKLDVSLVKEQIESSGFIIVEEKYGHLFFFVFHWIDKFLPLTKVPLVTKVYRHLAKIEQRLLRHRFFQRFAEVICFRCIKNE